MFLLRIQFVKACSVLADPKVDVAGLASLTVCYSISINVDVNRSGNVSISIKEHSLPNVVYQGALDRLVRPAMS